MSNATFHKRLGEVRLNEGLLDLWDILDSFAPGMYYYDPCYECNVVSAEFLARLPEFRKWAKARDSAGSAHGKSARTGSTAEFICLCADTGYRNTSAVDMCA